MSQEWFSVFDLAALPAGRLAYIAVDGLPIALANVAGTVYAVSDTCHHAGGPLSAGVLIDETITCPWHGWTYHVRSGKSIIPPIGLRIPTYPVRIEQGRIWVGVDWGVSE